MEIDGANKKRKEVLSLERPNPDDLRTIEDALAEIKKFIASIGRIIIRNNLKTNYVKNVKNYRKFVQGCYDYNRRSSSNDVIHRNPGQNILLLDLAVMTLYPALYKMEEITRYPHSDFS